MLITLISIVVTMVASGLGFRWARRFVSGRLRYVDAAQSRFAPIVAGASVALVAMPLTWLPLVGALFAMPAAIALGIGVGLGVASASRDIRIASYRIDR